MMTFFEMVEPESMFSFVLEEYQNGNMSIEECNKIGSNMPDGFQFQLMSEDEL